MRRKPGDILPLEAEILRLASQLAAQGTPQFYGWRMGQYLEDEAGRETGFGSLYRTLNRLEGHGYLTSKWIPPEKDGLPPKRVYEITAEGAMAYATARRTPVSEKFVPRFAI
jgi:PadR family transcriptional regulator, regulatory protein PadR